MSVTSSLFSLCSGWSVAPIFVFKVEEMLVAEGSDGRSDRNVVFAPE